MELVRYNGAALNTKKGAKEWRKYLDEQWSILYEPNAEEILDQKGLAIQAMLEQVFKDNGVEYTTEVRHENDNNRLIIKSELVEIYPVGRLNWQMGLGYFRLPSEPSLVNDNSTFEALNELAEALQDKRLVVSNKREAEKQAKYAI